MKIKHKISVFRSYGTKDLITKIINAPFKHFKNRNKQQLLKDLENRVLNQTFPTIEEYQKRKDERIIVSVTSFPQRFSQLVITLKSIILQDVVPSKIIVYLGSDTKKNDITDEMLKLKKFGVEYRIDTELNLKGHKKYYYALREFKDNIVITIDDDIIFPSTMVLELMRCYEKYPQSICARRVHKITQKKGHILPYNLWDKEYINSKKPSNKLIATTGAGTLYSPYVNNHLTKLTFDSNKITELCLEADDIWLKCMEIVSSIKVVFADNKIMGAFINVDEQYTLMPDNVGKCKNDFFLVNVSKYYNIDLDLFIND